jgi:thiol-disulfide isomerase/thioredoxin
MIRWFGSQTAEPTKIQQVGENMKSRNTLFSLVFLLGVLLTACGGAVTPEATMEDSHDETMTEPTHDATMDDSIPSPEADMNESADMMESPAWFSASLTDARTGQTFSINDFQGKVVLVETMAIWCSNCLKQQGQVKTLHEQLGARDDFISVGLDIDPNENTAALKSYVESKEFDWWYAVPSNNVSREIASLYGDQFLNPPSTPIVVIDRHGEAHPLPFGIKSADDLMQAIQPFLDENM